MSVAATSLQAWFEVNLEGIVQPQQQEIYRTIYINLTPMTRVEIADKTNIYPSTVGARANALVKAGHLIEGPKRQCKVTGRMAGTLEAV